ncbi:MAG: M1 family metallopeptidase [Myxococcota bacterium]|nr:M1 family metallopeptidase [Myxococcota bacterium]
MRAQDPFRQLDEIWPTPDRVRRASGAPGPDYWQQKVDYRIEAELDPSRSLLTGLAKISYHNRSPDQLDYLWLQLDQNRFKADSMGNRASVGPSFPKVHYGTLRRLQALRDRGHGYHIEALLDSEGAALPYEIVDTMLRVDLPTPLAAGASFSFSIRWRYQIIEAKVVGGRAGLERLPKSEAGAATEVFEIAQWFPRMASYYDVTGWQNKAFLGRGEFTLEFGDYDVSLTVPADHVVAATGVLSNPEEVLEAAWRERLIHAREAEKPSFVITPEEARERRGRTASQEKKTWRFRAENVRDFAFASSRAFIWDAWHHDNSLGKVMAMSRYPQEAEPLWSRYSTHAVVHTLEVYESFTFPYPYPVAISVHGPIWGMEYPMITFNGGRPELDGTYSRELKYALISVIIHEVGHFFFPMIVNSDERQWTWLDEGINTFLQTQAERRWSENYRIRRAEPEQLVSYMTSDDQVPVMTNSESLLQFGNNAYAKPAVALNVLRESVLGPESFDRAFRHYAKRWAFKRPAPSDFFRTLEDASGVDLDWFWRGWFYSTLSVDQGLGRVTHYRLKRGEVESDLRYARRQRDERSKSLFRMRSQPLSKRVDRFPDLADFYDDFDPLVPTPKQRRRSAERREKLSPEQREELQIGGHFYEIEVDNHGGLIMPIILRLREEGGGESLRRYPAEIWRRSPEQVKLSIWLERPLVAILLDPQREIGDADRSNNHFPSTLQEGEFELEESPWARSKENPMQAARREAERQKAEQQETTQPKPSEQTSGEAGTGEPVKAAGTRGERRDESSTLETVDGAEASSQREAQAPVSPKAASPTIERSGRKTQPTERAIPPAQ